MARNNKRRIAACLVLLTILLWLSGCASYQARSAYETAEIFSSREQYDLAVEKYAEAARLDPSNKRYKLQLISYKSKAAGQHLQQARQLAKEGRLEEARLEYRHAMSLDPNIEAIRQEEKQLSGLLEAQRFAEEGATFYGAKNLASARKAIEKALKLDANNARALAVKDLLDREQKKIAMDGVELDVASSEPITLRFKDANIKEVFGILSQLSGINFIFDEEIRSQTVSVLLENASFAQAMQLIMQMNGLGKKVLNSKTIIVYPLTRDKEKQYEDQLIQTFYLSHIDAKKAVNLLRTMLQLRKIYVHEERNALVVRDKPEVIRLAEQILNAADRENSEVVFDLEIVAVQNTDLLNIGPELSNYSVDIGLAKSKAGPLLANAIPADGVVTRLTQNLNGLQTFYTVPSATFDFAKTLTETEVLASPKIRVRNREKAKVHIGTREPVITVTTTGDTSTDNIQYVDVGVKVDVEPTIQLNNTVETKLSLEVSQVIDRVETTNGSVALTISTTNAQSVLTLKDGVQTILGGLFEQNDSNTRKTLPFLGEIPLLGKLFSSIDDQKRKREILLSITPYIVNQVDVPELDVATIWSGGEDNLKAGPNFGTFAQPLLSEVEAVKPAAAPAVKPFAPPETTDAEASAKPPAAQPVPAPAVIEEVPVLAPPVSESSPQADQSPVPAGEVVPTEELPQAAEVGAPLVLEMPAKPPTTLSFVGPQQVETGKEFTLAVEIKGIEQLYSAPLFIQYDPAVLELISVNEGTFLKQGDQSTVFSSSPNRSTGQVIVGYKQGTGGKGVSGDGNLFNLSFKPITAGETQVEVNRINFRNPEGIRLQVAPEAVKIEVR